MPNKASKWQTVSGDHPLACLQSRPLEANRLKIELGPTNSFGARYFRIWLVNSKLQVSHEPLLTGLFSRGSYPSYNWIEVISLGSEISFPDDERITVELNGLGTKLFGYLAELIPPGGHLMIEYDSPEQACTARLLNAGIPPAATPLGELLFKIGCGYGFRNWYFAEGWLEGPRRLQGYKPLTPEQGQQKACQIVQELIDFLNSPETCDRLENQARQEARSLLVFIANRHPTITSKLKTLQEVS